MIPLTKLRVLTTRLALGLLTLAVPARAQVLLTGSQGATEHTTIAAALAAAQDGDTLVLAQGRYPGFMLDGRGVSVRALRAGTVTITGTIHVRNLAAARLVALDGLSVDVPRLGGEALVVDACAGEVRAQACTFRGGEAHDAAFGCDPVAGARGVIVANSPHVALVDCRLRGGRGATPTSAFLCGLGAGGVGLFVSNSTVALWNCVAEGGDPAGPGSADTAQFATGGAGCSVTAGGRLFATECVLRGGDGGHGIDDNANGGPGLSVDSTSSAELRGVQLLGGAGAVGPNGPDAVAGPPQSGAGSVRVLSGGRASIRANTFVAGGSRVPVTIVGQPGDHVYFEVSLRPQFAAFADAGVWLTPLRAARRARMPDATLSANGRATIDVSVPELSGGALAAKLFTQVFVAPPGGRRMPAAGLVWDVRARTQLPDCNGNGIWDLLDLAQRSSGDCDLDFVPEDCASDCDFDGSSDACELALGVAADADLDATPDGCGANATLYVDSAASGPGVGTAVNPFPTLAQAFAQATHGTHIVVADGLYTGPSNRGLDFLGRRIVVRSANGAANCVLDLGGAATAFSAHSGENEARLEGLTIQNAGGLAGMVRVTNANMTLVNCAFRNTTTTVASVRGGALTVSNGSSQRVRILGCSFANFDLQSASSRGGAVSLSGGEFVIDRSTFRLCQASTGGALAIAGVVRGLVTSCTFSRNAASSFAGAVQLATGLGSELTFEQCLFVNNFSAGSAGALGVPETPVSLFVARRTAPAIHFRGCTLTGNSAQTSGGAFHLGGPAAVAFANCVAWGDSAPSGPELRLAQSDVTLAVEFSLVAGGALAIAGPGVTAWGFGNLDIDPLFADPNGPDGNPLTSADNDYTPGAGSPCIDAGDNTQLGFDLRDLDADGNVFEVIARDLAGRPRQVDDPGVVDVGCGAGARVDLGAFER